MLHITIGEASTIYFNASHTATISEPKFLFVFTSANNVEVFHYAENESTSKRYDKVTIDADKFDNFEQGIWEYVVYQKEDVSFEEGGLILDKGYMKLIGTRETTDTYYNEQSNIIIAHEQ